MLILIGSLFPNAKVFHLPRIRFDHCPLLLSSQPRVKLGPRPFRLELFWFKHPMFLSSIKKWWNSNTTGLDNKIASFLKNIVSWNKQNFDTIFYKKKRIVLKRLAGIQKSLAHNPSPQLQFLKPLFKKIFFNIVDQEEQLWYIKPRINWLFLGDKNNYFFHTSSLIKRRENKIYSFELEDGSTTFAYDIISSIIYDYFKNSYTTNISTIGQNFIIDTLPYINSNDHINLIFDNKTLFHLILDIFTK